MLGKNLQLYRAEIVFNGETSNIFFEDYNRFDEYASLMCKHWGSASESEIVDFKIVAHGWVDMTVTGC